MKRRDFLTATAVLGTASAPVLAEGPRLQWRLAASVSRTNDIIWEGLELIRRHVALATGGRFQIQIFSPGELVPAFGVLDAVKEGTVQIGQSSSFYYTGKEPAFAFDTALPFGLNSRQQTAWLMQGGGRELMREIFAEWNIHNLVCGNTGTQMGGWYRREIRDSGDLKGLKIRISGFGGQVLSKLGATPQVIPAADTYPALERGTIDAAKLSGPHDDERAGVNRVARYYYYPGWAEGGLQIALFVNRTEWLRLPIEYQTILENASMHAHALVQAGYDAGNGSAIRRLVAGGTQLRHFPGDVLAAAWRASKELNDELADRSPRFRKVYDQWRRFRARQIAWFGVAERPYDNFMGSMLRAGQ